MTGIEWMTAFAKQHAALKELRDSFAAVANAPVSKDWPEAHERRRAVWVVGVCDKALANGD